jgi:hypothetical protein
MWTGAMSYRGNKSVGSEVPASDSPPVGLRVRPGPGGLLHAPASALSGAPLSSALHQVIAFYKQCALDIAAQSVLLACVISMLAQRLGWM